MLVGERVLRKPLEQFSSAKYQVSGTLQDPELKFVGVWDNTMDQPQKVIEPAVDPELNAPETHTARRAIGITGEQTRRRQRESHRMKTQIQEAQKRLWVPGGIEQRDVEALMGRLMAKDVDIAELFFQYLRQESWALEDGIVKDGGFSVDQGVGVRAVSGEKTGFAYAEDLLLPSLRRLPRLRVRYPTG